MKNISKPKLINFFIVLAVILLLIFFNWRGWLAVPKSLVFWAARPLVSLFQVVDEWVSLPWNFFITLKDLSKDNADLTSANKILLGEMARLKEAARENELLRQRLELGLSEKQNLVMAAAVGFNLTPGQYLLINKGRADGVATGLAVVTANNFLIGRVAEAEDNFSRVLLISDGSSVINALTQDTRINGAVRGSYGLGLTLEMIPIDAQININELVLSSGLNDGIPKGLVIGRIVSVEKKPNEIWQSAVLASPTDIKSLEWVFVIRP